MFYEVPREAVARAALLRAQAGRLRDDTADRPDWKEVGRLLRESYSGLRSALDDAP